MRDGLYLSTYLTPPGLCAAVGLWLRHDNNMSLWEKSGSSVRLLGHWELERFSGMKHHGLAAATPQRLRKVLDEILGGHGVRLADVAEIWGTPGLSTIDEERWLPPQPELPHHSIAHLYSAMLLDSDAFFDGHVIGLALDAGPDDVLEQRAKSYWYAGAVVRQGRTELFPAASPGPLYYAARQRFGLREGTLMALATATDAHARVDRAPLVAEALRLTDPSAEQRADRLLDAVVAQVKATLTTGPQRGFSERELLVSAVMKEVQEICTTQVEHTLDTVLSRFGLRSEETHLAMAGGFALNCPTNTRLMRRYSFRSLLAPPWVNDSGQSVGIALSAFHHRLGRFSFRYPGPYLGSQDDDLDGALNRYRDHIAHAATDTAPHLDTAVADLVSGPVVWFDGRAEAGPRALGHRSILSDPRSAAAKDRLNALKQRQWWRPVAPIVLEEELDGWFVDAWPSPSMLATFDIRPEQRDRIPAVAHLDASARLQTLRREQNPLLYDLIAHFHAQTGVPLVCNTSLNDKEEPIVDTIDQTVNFCLRRGVNVAYFGGRRVAFRRHSTYQPTYPLPRRHLPFARPTGSELAALQSEHNPHGLTDLHLQLYLRNPTLRQLDIRSETGARTIERSLRVLRRTAPQQIDAIETAMRGQRRFAPSGRPVPPGAAEKEDHCV